jgi:hypothetical protein
LKETRPLWPPQRGVGLREPNLGKTNPRVSLDYSLAICFAPSLVESIIFLTLTRLVVVIIFENFSFALFTPPLGDFHISHKQHKSNKFSHHYQHNYPTLKNISLNYLTKHYQHLTSSDRVISQSMNNTKKEIAQRRDCP